MRLKNLHTQIELFWQRNPGCLYGLSFYLGFLFILHTHWAILPLAFLCIHKKYILAVTIFFLAPSGIVYTLYTFPQTGTQVEGIFVIGAVKKSERFKEGWSYKGILKTDEGRIAVNCFSKSYYNPNALYQVQGVIRRPLRGKGYVLKAKGPWKFIKDRFSLVAWRGVAQEYVKAYIEKHIAQKRAALFLQGMLIGDLDNKILKNEFNQLGLSHLMAISGLHFSLIALAFHLLLRLFLPHKIEALFLIVLLTLYLLFIGDTPSVVRTWLTFTLFLSGQLLEKRSTPLNALGVSLFISLLWNPLSAITLSFQLSFLATAGILFFYAPFNTLFQLWLPKFYLKDIIKKNWLWQHGYILLSFLRDALALTCAVHTTIILVLINAFHTLPLNSFVYNLFFPFLASLSLLFFLVSIPLGHWSHVLNGYYCEWILRIPESPPIFLKPLYFQQLPISISCALFTFLLIAAVATKINHVPVGKKDTDCFSLQWL